MSGDSDELDLSAVPLFPLPNVVLFPNAILPLHIFEERYKEMTADALSGRRLVAMALLRPGWVQEYHARPPIEPIVCVGHILNHEHLADGTYNFLLKGLARASIVKERSGRSYRIAELQRISEVPAAEESLVEARQRLDTIFSRSALAHTGLGGQFAKMLDGAVSTATIVDLIAFNLLEDLSLRQTLLAEPDVRRRVLKAVTALEQVVAGLPEPVAPARRGFGDPSLN